MPPARAAAAPADREPAPLLLRHAFLQAVMARAYLLESDAKLIAARVLGPASGARRRRHAAAAAPARPPAAANTDRDPKP
jgi:hypothetical protein